MKQYQIFTDATSDLTDVPMAGLPSVEIIPMEIEIDGRTYQYGPMGNITVRDFYDLQKNGADIKTTGINPWTYRSYFEPVLQKGLDILYLCFSSGLSGTIMSARLSAEELQKKYPERRIICIDTLCASLGEGFLVREAARKQAEGLSLDELVQWVTEHRVEVCHWFTVDTFEHLRKGGRVSAAAAATGTVLQIKPTLHVDENGHLAVMGKPRGRKQANRKLLEKIEAGWEPETGKLIIVGHGDCPDGGEVLKAAIETRFPEAEIYVMDIGPVIGAHTGPGMLAVLFWGNMR